MTLAQGIQKQEYEQGTLRRRGWAGTPKTDPGVQDLNVLGNSSFIRNFTGKLCNVCSQRSGRI